MKYNRGGSIGWVYLLLCAVSTGIPLLMLIIFSNMNRRSIAKRKKNGLIISKKIKVMNTINILFVPFIIIFCFF